MMKGLYMASLSRTDKWLFIIVLFATCLSFTIVLLHPWIKTPYDYPDSEWICGEPEMYLYFGDKESHCSKGYVVIDGERIPVEFTSNGFEGSLIKQNRSGNSDDIIYHFQFRCNKNELVLIIKWGYAKANTEITLNRIAK